MRLEPAPFYDGINPEQRFAVLSADGNYLGCITERREFSHRFFAEGNALCSALRVKSWRTRAEAEEAVSQCLTDQ